MINLSPADNLSDQNQIGAGGQTPSAPAKQIERKQKKIVHVKGSMDNSNGSFIAQQQTLLDAIKRQDKTINEAKRIGFLGVMNEQKSYKAYQKYWETYVGEFGTAHYPSVLVNNSLSGSLDLDIAIDQQGVVRGVDVHRSSGNSEIDNAAIEIAILASPYKALPKEIADEVDELHIIRTWTFDNHTLTSQARK